MDNNNNKFELMKWESEDQISGFSDLVTRSYSCSFCKRGFSNAQALGGHMNIHRRDRAIIRQRFSEENKINNNYSSEYTNPDHQDQYGLSSSKTQKSDHHRQHQTLGSIPVQLDLSLLAEQHSNKPRVDSQTMTGSDDDHVGSFVGEPSVTAGAAVVEERKTEELDLELRLGPERRHHDDRTTLSTREFF
ncbi:hypothetical protein CsatA_022851 [Cannabis sativa]